MSKLSTRNINAEVGARLVSVRVSVDLTQAQMADRLGLTPRAYGSYERGDREIPTMLFRALYKELDIDPIWLLDGPGAPPVLSGQRRIHGDLLEQIVELIEDWLIKNRRALKPEKKARVIRLAYEHCSAKAKIDSAHLKEMLSLAA
jgi:transcriptional regulator with XRE-family HTH domain